MSLPIPNVEMNAMTIADEQPHPTKTPHPAIRPIDILTSLPHSSPSSQISKRPIDIIKSLAQHRVSGSVASVDVHPPPLKRMRPVDILAELQAWPSPPLTSLAPPPNVIPPARPIDILASLRTPGSETVKTETRGSLQIASTPSTSSSRTIARLPKRAAQPPTSSSTQPQPPNVPSFYKEAHDPERPLKKLKSVFVMPSIQEDIVMEPPTHIKDPNFIDLTLDPPSSAENTSFN